MIGHDPTRTYRAAIIGAGSGGLTAAIGLARLGHDTVLIEGDRVGGDCTNVGCIPSKALLHAAATGVTDPLGWARDRRDRLAADEEREMAEHSRIHLVHGWGQLTAASSPHVVRAATQDGDVEVRAEHVVIAGGSRPTPIEIPGVDPCRILTNETLFDVPARPTRMVIVGAGPTGLEMADAFALQGTEVHLVERVPALFPAEDRRVGQAVRAGLERLGVEFHLGCTVERGDENAAGVNLHLDDGSTIDHVDRVLVAAGRQPRLDRLGLEHAGVDHGVRGVSTDSWGRTSIDGIWAVGDVTGATATTHGASAVGRRIVRAIAYPQLPRRGRPRAIPTAVFGSVEVAMVGRSAEEVEAAPPDGRRRYVVALSDLDRGYTDDIEHGLVLVDVQRFTGKILRAVIVGPHAAELIGQFTLAIDQGISLRKFFGLVPPYPTLSEAPANLADQFAFDTLAHPLRELSAAARAWLGRRLPSRG